MRISSTWRWLIIGVLGVVFAASLSYAAFQLTSQTIGLTGEPGSAGNSLAPPPVDRGSKDSRKGESGATGSDSKKESRSSKRDEGSGAADNSVPSTPKTVPESPRRTAQDDKGKEDVENESEHENESDNDD